jgi:hypothetical protein
MMYQGQFNSSGDMHAKAGANDVYGDQNARPTGAAGSDPTRDLEQLGLLTGGRAYFKQEMPAVVQQVIGNTGNMYEIAYAPPADNWDNKFHTIHITCERKGIRLISKERYYAIAETRSAQDLQRAAVMAAYQSPADFADIGLNVKLNPAASGVHMDVRIDPADILLSEQGGKFAGGLVFFVSDRGASGPLGDPAVSPLSLDLTKEQHDKVMKEGIPIAQDHPLNDAVKLVRVIVLDLTTNKVGSLTFPVR